MAKFFQQIYRLFTVTLVVHSKQQIKYETSQKKKFSLFTSNANAACIIRNIVKQYKICSSQKVQQKIPEVIHLMFIIVRN